MRHNYECKQGMAHVNVGIVKMFQQVFDTANCFCSSEMCNIVAKLMFVHCVPGVLQTFLWHMYRESQVT